MEPEVEAARSLIGVGYKNKMEVSGLGGGLCAGLITRIEAWSGWRAIPSPLPHARKGGRKLRDFKELVGSLLSEMFRHHWRQLLKALTTPQIELLYIKH